MYLPKKLTVNPPLPGNWTELWLITEYHELGSLYDFLSQNTLNNYDMLIFALSIANGLTFLHSEIRGTSGTLNANGNNYHCTSGTCTTRYTTHVL